MRFQKYIAILSDDLYLYSKKETFYIRNVVYIDDSYFYIKEGKKFYRLAHYYGHREEVCMKNECSSDEMVMAMCGVRVDDLVYHNYTKIGENGGHSTELVGIYDRHLVLKKGTRVFYRKNVFDAVLAHLYKKYLVLVQDGTVSFFDLETLNSNQISCRVRHGIRTKSLNCDTFLKVDDMLVYGNTVVSSKYKRIVICDLMHEFVTCAKDRGTAYTFMYLESCNFEGLNAVFGKHFEHCNGMLVQDFRLLVQNVFDSEFERFNDGFVQYVRNQEMDLKGITQNVILKGGVRRVLDEIFLIMVFYKITSDEFFFNLMRLRFVYDVGADRALISNAGCGESVGSSRRSRVAGDALISNAGENTNKLEGPVTISPSMNALTRKSVGTEKLLNIQYERLFFYDKSVCINGMVKKHRAQKDVECVKKILYESKIRFDAEDLEGKRKDAQNIRKHASLGDALVFFLSKKMGRKKLSDKLMNRNITKLNEVRALLAKKTHSLLSVLLTDHVTKLREKSERRGPYSNERRKFYDFYYRLVHTIKYSEVICTYTPMSDLFLELVLNGFMFMNTDKQWVKRKLYRKDDSKPEEIFMSEVLKSCIDFEEIDLKELVVVKDNQSNSYYYRMAGRLFYVCLWFMSYCDKINKKALEKADCTLTAEKEKELVKDRKRKEITQELLRFCLEMEEKMHRKKCFQIIFDYALIVLSVINAGTCELDVLRIVRRKILETKDSKFLVNKTTFYVCCDEGIYVTSSLNYGQILKYKMCLGILCSGLGNYRLKERMSTVKYLIISFYPVWPVAIDDHKDYTECRYVICNALEKKPMAHSYRVIYGDEYDKKYRLDILSDYCEKNDECVEKWQHLINLMLEMK